MGRTRIAFRVRDTDRGWRKMKALANRIGEDKTFVKVGIVGPGATKTEGGISTVGLALVHEFGVPELGIPERSFIRSTFDRNRGAYKALLKQLWKAVLLGRVTEQQALGILGSRMAADIKAYVTHGAGVPPPLKEATIQRKGSSRPLVDTGRMLASVSWVVVLKGKEVGR